MRRAHVTPSRVIKRWILGAFGFAFEEFPALVEAELPLSLIRSHELGCWE
jgi:hypothetical protein